MAAPHWKSTPAEEQAAIQAAETGNLEPLASLFEADRASRRLQKWLAEKLRAGGFDRDDERRAAQVQGHLWIDPAERGE